MNTFPNPTPVAYDLETVVGRIASACGYSVPAPVVKKVREAEAADRQRLAIIEQAGRTGAKRMQAAQQLAVVEAAEAGQPLPQASPIEPNLAQAVELQLAALKENRAKRNAFLWPLIGETWAAFLAKANTWADGIGDVEAELAARIGIQFVPSATLQVIKHALGRLASKTQPPKNPDKLNASPASCFAGLISE